MSEMDNEIQWEQTNEVQLLFRENGPVCVCGKWKSKLLLHSFVRRVYAPQFFVSSQQRFGAMDIKALGGVTALGSWTSCVIGLRQISVTALFYLEDSRRIHP